MGDFVLKVIPADDSLPAVLKYFSRPKTVINKDLFLRKSKIIRPTLSNKKEFNFILTLTVYGKFVHKPFSLMRFPMGVYIIIGLPSASLTVLLLREEKIINRFRDLTAGDNKYTIN